MKQELTLIKLPKLILEDIANKIEQELKDIALINFNDKKIDKEVMDHINTIFKELRYLKDVNYLKTYPIDINKNN